MMIWIAGITHCDIQSNGKEENVFRPRVGLNHQPFG